MKTLALLLLSGTLGVTQTACSIQVDHGATEYSCVENPVCPSGFECIAGNCVAVGGASVDAGVDAGPVDAAPGEVDADVAPPIDASATTVMVQVSTGSDDAEELVADGTVNLASTDLELVVAVAAEQIVGVRFAAVDVPPGVLITSASIQFTVDEVSIGDATVAIGAEASPNPATFTTTPTDISGRTPLGAPLLVAWTIDPWPTIDVAGPAQQTPDISALVQALIEQDGWQAGNAMVFGFTGTGTRTAESFNGVPAAAPILQIVYQ